MNPQDMKPEGWVLIHPETDEFYGTVQWRDKNGNMTDIKEVVQMWPPDNHYVFCRSGGGIEIVK